MQSRKQFLRKAAIGGMALTAGLSVVNQASAKILTDSSDTTLHSAGTVSAKEFRAGVMPRAQLSLAASKIAVDKASNANTREFASWELMEAIAVVDYLKDLGTPTVALDPGAQDFLNKLKSLEGSAFDKTYMQAEQANHEWLRDLAQQYLHGNDVKKSNADTYRLATVALFSFTEHVGLSKKINAELNA